MTLTPIETRIDATMMWRTEGERRVYHMFDRIRDDQWDPVCGSIALEVTSLNGMTVCCACLRWIGRVLEPDK